ncbi:phage virion morphogenesis protein [Roseospira marina]|uniref:Phage virion morphogenesis protein n=1 Tax=Roseospira marina TaxID=140057 RepID=A0A5M6I4S3_9PROT|nr:phage virion morphogenesis protein [Roseospira marina]KAA5603221.1 phage virion morphogenesis protein [Roseospira marina]MBB4316205.1 phage virion morphogenesis protein [Roseospira marina]MBB5089403.1 phage virion morphogenesis protein [Roseospira marina]
MAGISITVSGDEFVGRGLDGLIARTGDLTPAMDMIGTMLDTSVDHRFETETDPDGQPWPKSIRALSEGGQTLTDRRHLRGSITHEAGPTSVRQGTNLIYARPHQLGALIKPKAAKALTFRIGGRTVQVQQVTIPARPYLGLSAEDRTEAGEIIADWVTGAL